jgi:hypothetical protein
VRVANVAGVDRHIVPVHPGNGAAGSRWFTPWVAEMTGPRSDPPPHRYRIRISDRLGERIRSAFPALSGSDDRLRHRVTGTLCDQAALHGVLAEIEALGLELLEVRRLPPA